MSALERIIDLAKARTRKIVLPEANDIRIIEAATLISEAGLAEVILVGNQDTVKDLAKINDLDLGSISIMDPNNCAKFNCYAQTLLEKRKHKGLTEQQAIEQSKNSLTFAMLMVAADDADGCVAGAVNTTSDVVRNALQIIGMKPRSDLVSSCFLMEHQLEHQAIQGTVIYADCALVIDPDAKQLAGIAIASANSARDLAGLEPKVALLSFSTAGSARHANVDKVIEAGEIITQAQPGFELMTEVQFDAAVLPEVLKQKAPNIKVSAPANVFIFPDLQSANIGYKIAQRIGGVKAIGPILQGLNSPVNDLSRGCSVEDIVQLTAVTAVQVD